jgi:hypothetical protein
MAEGSINGNGIPCVLTRFSGSGRLELAGAANNDGFARGSPPILDAGWRAGARAAEVPLDGEGVDSPQD